MWILGLKGINNRVHKFCSAANIAILLCVLTLDCYIFQFQPPVAPRAHCGFVGLKNAGATCYMNSVLQQLYMQPALREVWKIIFAFTKWKVVLNT